MMHPQKIALIIVSQCSRTRTHAVHGSGQRGHMGYVPSDVWGAVPNLVPRHAFTRMQRRRERGEPEL